MTYTDLSEFKNHLQSGDVIMHHAHGFISNTIRKFNRSNYNHCSVYDKNGYVYESVTGGIQRKTVEDSLKTQKTYAISIYRLNSSSEDKIVKVTETIQNHYTSKIYAYSQIGYLGILLARKFYGTNSKFRKYTYKYFLYACDLFGKIMDPLNKNHTCSELVYRAYKQTANTLKDPELYIVFPFESSPLNYNNTTYLPENSTNSSSKKGILVIINNTYSLIKKSIPIFFSASFLSQNATNDLQNIKQELSEILTEIDIDNFITPGDLEKAINLDFIATYKTDKSDRKCNFCNY